MRLTLSNQLSPLLDPGYVEDAIRGHFAPLFDAAFDEFLGRKYPRGVSFRIDGQELARAPHWRAPSVHRFRSGSADAGLRRRPDSSNVTNFRKAERQGLAVSTFGKVIKREPGLARHQARRPRTSAD